MLDERLGHSHGAHGVNGEHPRPGFVVNVSDGLAPRSDDASIVEQKVDRLSIELSCCRMAQMGAKRRLQGGAQVRRR
jgi:hypothetical protein